MLFRLPWFFLYRLISGGPLPYITCGSGFFVAIEVWLGAHYYRPKNFRQWGRGTVSIIMQKAKIKIGDKYPLFRFILNNLFFCLLLCNAFHFSYKFIANFYVFICRIVVYNYVYIIINLFSVLFPNIIQFF